VRFDRPPGGRSIAGDPPVSGQRLRQPGRQAGTSIPGHPGDCSVMRSPRSAHGLLERDSNQRATRPVVAGSGPVGWPRVTKGTHRPLMQPGGHDISGNLISRPKVWPALHTTGPSGFDPTGGNSSWPTHGCPEPDDCTPDTTPPLQGGAPRAVWHTSENDPRRSPRVRWRSAWSSRHERPCRVEPLHRRTRADGAAPRPRSCSRGHRP